MSAAKITEHWNLLRKRGLDLGTAAAPAQDAGYGGLLQRFQRGTIYWHPNTGAHEVHGGILTRYNNGGAQGPNPATGERELGFPTSDETISEDGRFPYSVFEWGTIGWVRGTGGVRLFGTLYNAWKAAGGVHSSLGHPLQDVVRIGGGRAAYFERGVLWHADNSTAVLQGDLIPPLLGCPQLIDPGNPPQLPWMRFRGAVAALDAHPELATTLWKQRLRLIPVGSTVIPQVELKPGALTTDGGIRVLSFTVARSTTAGGTHGVDVHTSATTASAGTTATGSASTSTAGASTGGMSTSTGGGNTTVTTGGLTRRTLYSLAFCVPGIAPIIIAPHDIYARSDWESFNIAHITDIHSSRRVEKYRAQLRKAGVPAADLALFNNWNDSFREFIRFANKQHAAGQLDAIMATGDLVDYVHEVGDHPHGPGNFEFFENLVRGTAQSPDPESPSAEPLRVPIFTSLGNHDYRAWPYALAFKIKVSSGDVVGSFLHDITGGAIDIVVDAVGSALDMVPGIGLLGLIDPISALSLSLIDAQFQYSGLNVTRAEALKLIGLRGKNQNEWFIPVLTPESAAKQVLVEPSMLNESNYYFRHINRNRSYFVRMGQHRLLMLDTRQDKDITDTLTETVITKLGFGSESSEHFLDGSPDSTGVNTDELALLRAALDSAGERGLVLVGMHAPPINPAGNMMLPHFRETMHPGASPEHITSFLFRNKPMTVAAMQNSQLVPRPDALTNTPSWPRNGTPYFHIGTVEDLMDMGIAVGHQEELMKIVSGGDGRRPVTLLLCGHGHYRFDFRTRWNAAKQQLEMYTDHYFENPTSYYPVSLPGQWWKESSYRRRLVNIKAGTPAEGAEQIVNDNRAGATWKDLSTFNTPPYARPLSDATDPAQWWRDHQPVVVQTAALGPASNTRRDKDTNENAPGPNFQGFRIIEIADNVIRSVRYITMDLLRSGNLNPTRPPLSTQPPVVLGDPPTPSGNAPAPIGGASGGNSSGASGGDGKPVVRDHRKPAAGSDEKDSRTPKDTSKPVIRDHRQK